MNSFLQKASDAAADARMLFAGRRFDSACNRAYYAMFHAARALLLSRGHRSDQAKTHASVLRQFSLEFVRSGPFEADDGRALRRAEKVRYLADYGESEVTEEEARAVIASMERFISTAERTLGSLPRHHGGTS